MFYLIKKTIAILEIIGIITVRHLLYYFFEAGESIERALTNNHCVFIEGFELMTYIDFNL